jgi:hypothetical protein
VFAEIDDIEIAGRQVMSAVFATVGEESDSVRDASA